MSDTGIVVNFPQNESVEFQQWHEGQRVILDGRIVPNLRAFRGAGDNWTLSLNRRFGMDGTEAEIKKWVWFIANAMAVGAGYSCFGEHSGPINPFKPGKLVGVTLGASPDVPPSGEE